LVATWVVPDCSALKQNSRCSSRASTVVSDEPEPQTLLQTCLLVAPARHCQVWAVSSQSGKPSTHRPTGRSKSSTIAIYLPLQNIALLQEYLDLVYSLLDRATGCAYQTRYPKPETLHPRARQTDSRYCTVAWRSHSVLLEQSVWFRCRPTRATAESHGSRLLPEATQQQPCTLVVLRCRSRAQQRPKTPDVLTRRGIIRRQHRAHPKYEAALHEMRNLCLKRLASSTSTSSDRASVGTLESRSLPVLLRRPKSGLPHAARECPRGKEEGPSLHKW
jgi:hypothetical protein